MPEPSPREQANRPASREHNFRWDVDPARQKTSDFRRRPLASYLMFVCLGFRHRRWDFF